jgi:uncharacterized protein (TIGR03437 family)
MMSLQLPAALFLLAAGLAAQVPTIRSGGVVNLSGGGLSPGGLFSIYGTGLGGSGQSSTGFPLPTILGGVSVLVNGVAVPLVYAGANQINAQMPHGIGVGRATVSVRNATGTTAEAVVEIRRAAPAILVYEEDRAVATSDDAVLNTPATPALTGDVVVVYLTGIGALDGQPAAGEAAPLDRLYQAVLPAEATIGGARTTVKFLGLAPGFAGLAQANLIVPPLRTGSYPVEVTVNGVKSNSATITVWERRTILLPTPPIKRFSRK